jgi:YidC/Oxa1 family membrane protein insertase
MDKRTVIAVVLAVVVIVGSLLVQQIFFPAQAPAPSAQQPPAVTEQPGEAQPPATQEAPPEAAAQTAQQAGPAQARAPAGEPSAVPEAQLQEESYTLDTDVFRAEFTNRGGELTSLELKQYKNSDGSPVNMIFTGTAVQRPFSIHFGDFESPAVEALFQREQALTGEGVSYFRTFNSPSGVPFILRKTYLFHPDDYMIELRVSIENSINEYPDLNFGGVAYTLGFGPQIGPPFAKLDRRNEYRNYMYYSEGKARNVRIPREGFTSIDKRVTWAAIVGKYFEVIAVPDATPYTITFDTRQVTGLPDRSSLFFSRPEIKSSKNTDVFRFFVGPKKRDVLVDYNDPGKNAYGLADMHFEDSISSSVLIGWLANILKFLLELFYRIVPNYGVAIILLTIVIKALFFPLTRKSFESTSKMQALQPKINELRERLKNNPQKLNQEMAALYKREGVSPLGGCLPLLLQLPIFFALYNLLNSHFALRGAVFIPGWINDLSAPESILDLPFSIPILGWHNLRVLPFVMLVTTFIQSRVSQPPDGSSRNMQMMTYLMPVVFFFILYDMPSGLVLYWTMQNVLTILQQMYTNRVRARRSAQQPPQPPPLPPSARKKRK